MRLKKGAKFLLSYNMKIVGGREEGGGMKLWWGIKFGGGKEESIGGDFSSHVGGGGISKFLASGEKPHPIFLRGGLPPAATTLMDVVRRVQSHSKQQVRYISIMCWFFGCS